MGVIYRLERLLEANQNDDLKDYLRGFTVFGGDGGGGAYAWDWLRRRGSLCVVIPWIGCTFEEDAIRCGNSFEAFLSILREGTPFEP